MLLRSYPAPGQSRSLSNTATKNDPPQKAIISAQVSWSPRRIFYVVFFLASTRSRRPLVSGAVDHSKWSRQIVSMAATNSKQTDNGSNDRRRTISPSLSLRSSILRWSRAVSCCEFVSRPTVAVGKGPQHYSSPSSSAVARAESGSRTRLSVPRTFHSVAVRIVTIALLHISFACGREPALAAGAIRSAWPKHSYTK